MTKQEHLDKIKSADHAYYALDNPIMSDAEYDKLRREYIKKYGSNDLNYVPGSVTKDFEKFKHPFVIGSLDKWTKGVDDEKDLKKRISDLWPVEIQPKLDGLTIVAYPNSDGSCKFVTRGGGDTGEILPNFIPKYEGIHVNDSGYPFRGEAFITSSNFKILNESLKKEGKEEMKNKRNAAAGLLRRKERSKYLHLLSFIVYDMLGNDVSPEKMRQAAEKTKFEFIAGYHVENVEDAIKCIENIYEEYNKKDGCPIDGIVVKTTQDNSLKKFGSTGHHPRNAFAWKAIQEEVETIVRDVVWQMGRNKATPVAIVDPVEIDGTTVMKSSLHNAEMISKLGVKIGAKVKIRKANQIIPQIVSVVEPGNVDIILNVCPACGKPLETINGQQFCTNDQCDERIAQNIAFLGKKNVLDIPTLSIQTARKIIAAYHDKIENMSNPQNIIFTLKVEDIASLSGMGDKSAQTLIDNIEKAKKKDFATFIKALCIKNVGNDIGKHLSETFITIEKMKECYQEDPVAFEEKILEVSGIGLETSRILTNEKFWKAVDDLGKYIEVNYETKEKTGSFAGKVFALTGKMEKVRSYYEELIEQAGGEVTNSVNKKTNYLVIQDVNSMSSKAKKARELGTKLISPEELEKMLK